MKAARMETKKLEKMDLTGHEGIEAGKVGIEEFEVPKIAIDTYDPLAMAPRGIL